MPDSPQSSPKQLSSLAAAAYPEAGPEVALAIIRMEYRYAMAGLAIAGVGLVSIVGGFIYLVMNGHPQAAGCLLGAGVLSLITAFIKTRLSSS